MKTPKNHCGTSVSSGFWCKEFNQKKVQECSVSARFACSWNNHSCQTSQRRSVERDCREEAIGIPSDGSRMDVPVPFRSERAVCCTERAPNRRQGVGTSAIAGENLLPWDR